MQVVVDSAQEALAGRVRAALAGTSDVDERAMFGTRAFLVAGRLVVCARKGGGLLVRVDPSRSAEPTARAGAVQAEMGAGRSMGPGWLDVSAEAVADEDGLRAWLGEALRRRSA